MMSKKKRKTLDQDQTMSLGQWLFVVGGMFTIVTATCAAVSVDELPAADNLLHFWLRIPLEYWGVYMTFIAFGMIIATFGYFRDEVERTPTAVRLHKLIGLSGLFIVFSTPALKIYLEHGGADFYSEFVTFALGEFAPYYVAMTVVAVAWSLTLFTGSEK